MARASGSGGCRGAGQLAPVEDRGCYYLAMCPVLSAVETEARFLDWPVARLATLRPGGAPHLVPVVFVYSAGAFWIPVDGKAKRDRPLERVRNIEGDARVTLLLDAYDEDWSALWWIHVEGRAVLRRDSDHPRFRGAEEGLRRKYPQYREVPLFRDEAILVEITPERRNTWCASRDRGQRAGES